MTFKRIRAAWKPSVTQTKHLRRKEKGGIGNDGHDHVNITRRSSRHTMVLSHWKHFLPDMKISHNIMRGQKEIDCSTYGIASIRTLGIYCGTERRPNTQNH